MQKQVVHERQDTTKSFVAKAMEYVEEHYGDQDLSIETICSYLSVSAAYFSTVFKKETGKTFINYLTDYRMQQAVELLLTQNEKFHLLNIKQVIRSSLEKNERILPADNFICQEKNKASVHTGNDLSFFYACLYLQYGTFGCYAVQSFCEQNGGHDN